MHIPVFISEEEFLHLLNDGQIVDVVIGRSHDEGNIYMIVKIQNGYTIKEHMEGGEYIINHKSSVKHWDRIKAINSVVGNTRLIDIDILRHTPLLVTQSTPKDKFLLIDEQGQYVVNKNATCLFLKELNEINSKK